MPLLSGTFGLTYTITNSNVHKSVYSVEKQLNTFVLDEERGRCIESFAISIYRRWNYENNIAALVCLVESQDDVVELNETVFIETIGYVIEKLQQGHENDEKSVYDIKIFYPVDKRFEAEQFLRHLNTLKETMSVVYTFVPVVCLKNKNTYLSITGVRNQ